MNHPKYKSRLHGILTLMLTLLLASCSVQGGKNTTPNDGPPEEGAEQPTYVNVDQLEIPEVFTYSATQTVTLTITAKDADNLALDNTLFSIYHSYDLNSEENPDPGILAFSGLTNELGAFQEELELPSHVDSLLFKLEYPGVPEIEVSIRDGAAGAAFAVSTVRATETQTVLAQNLETLAIDFTTLGSWSPSGVPNYLTDANRPSRRLSQLIASWFPEGKPVPQFNPDYISDTAESNINFTQDGEAWLTFYHEGAGYRNMLGYYTFDLNNPPTTAADVDEHILIFPNASLRYSGGNLIPGDRVQLKYKPGTEQESTTFPAGTGIGWFIVANGWRNSPTDGINIYFSDPNLNPEQAASKRRHSALVFDPEEQVMILGFEDLFREGRTDDDFNDAIVQIEVSSFDVIETEDFTPVNDDGIEDSDGDGVKDSDDAYPNDPDKAFNNYFPNANDYGTLAFEDRWPYTGDYDFNDLVVDYRINQITNARNRVTQIEGEYVLQAAGAAYVNAFAFELPIAADLVKSVSGNKINTGGPYSWLEFNANGTEANQTNAVIFVSDHSGRDLGYIVNTLPDGNTVEATTINVSIELNEALKRNQLGSAPYNPFIVSNIGGITLQNAETWKSNRGNEIHLPFHSPTDLADQSLFGTGDDNSKGKGKKTYVSQKHLPWALHIPSKYDWTTENSEITWGYYNFANWATSGGKNSKQWYLDKGGYRNPVHVFKTAK